jgi:hypothetical protein
MPRLRNHIWTGLVMLAFSASAGWAQDTGNQPSTPVAPMQQGAPGATGATGDTSGNANQGGDTEQNPIPAKVEMEAPPATSAAVPSLVAGVTRSFVLPEFDYYGQYDTNGENTTNSNGSNQAITEHTFLGGITLQKVTSRTQFNLSYAGGRSFSPEGGYYDATTQIFGASEKFVGNRWAGFVSDEMSYMSQSTFGGGITPDLGGGFVGSGVNLQPVFLPGQTVFTAYGPRISNASVGELDYQAGPRTSITFAGIYDLLHFFNAGLINSYSAGGQVGFNYQKTARDTISLVYRFDALRYSNDILSVNDNVIELGYRRLVAQRLSFNIAAGPDIAQIHDPIKGVFDRTSYAINASLGYALKRATLGAAYDHYLTTGSGILTGSYTDQFSADLNLQLARLWTLGLTALYARNSGIPGTSSSSANESLNAVAGDIRLTRTIGRASSIFAGYSPRDQQRTLSGVSSSIFANQIMFGVSWRPAPIPID